MGRTNPTFRDVLRGVRRRWAPFRRGLRREEQAVFDDLLEKAGAHADAAGYANPVDPVPLVLLSVLLEQQAEIDALEARVAELGDGLDAAEEMAERAADERAAEGRETAVEVVENRETAVEVVEDRETAADGDEASEADDASGR